MKKFIIKIDGKMFKKVSSVKMIKIKPAAENCRTNLISVFDRHKNLLFSKHMDAAELYDIYSGMNCYKD